MVELVGGLIALLLIAATLLAVTKIIRFPFSVLLVFVGAGLAALAEFSEAMSGIVDRLTLSPDLILYVFLPTLIFESAYHLDVRQLRHNLRPVLTLAVPGLLLSTLIIGAIVSSVTRIPLSVAMLLGGPKVPRPSVFSYQIISSASWKNTSLKNTSTSRSPSPSRSAA